jgi:outer membrane protein assembly factor BamB
VTTKFAFLACPFFLLVWFAAGTQSYAADTSDSNKSAKQEVLEHHQNATRGLFVVPSLTWDRARNLHRDPNFHADVAGPVYSQPLYWCSPGSAKALLLVATEQNLVYALDAETGATAWKTALGPPVPRAEVHVTGNPLPQNPKTSWLTALSLARAVLNSRARVII